MRIGIFAFLLSTGLAGIMAAQETNFAVGPQYLMTSGSPLFAQPIATPTLSLGEQASEPNLLNNESVEHASVSADETLDAILELQRQLTLPAIYYGSPRVSVVEISFREPEGRGRWSAIPGSITNDGVAEAVDMQALRLRGYGVTLPEAAGYWKAHRPATAKRYTNADVERLPKP